MEQFCPNPCRFLKVCGFYTNPYRLPYNFVASVPEFGFAVRFVGATTTSASLHVPSAQAGQTRLVIVTCFLFVGRGGHKNVKLFLWPLFHIHTNALLYA